MGFRLGQWVTYKPNAKLFVGSLCLSVAAFAVYLRYFDILAPFIPEGSVRANSWDLFPSSVHTRRRALLAAGVLSIMIVIAS